MEASLFRLRRTCSTSEYDLLSQAERRAFPYLPDNGSCLERMTFFQHYGLPTRLLDITYNPLVALYFACYNLTSKDGKLYYGWRTIEDNPLYANIIADYVFNSTTCEDSMIMFESLSRLCNRYNLPNSPVSLINALSLVLYIAPPLSNRRLMAQQGAFLMTPLLRPFHENDEEGNLYSIDDIDAQENLYGFKGAFTIPASKKKIILRQLRLLGISKSTLFPELSSVLSDIKDEALDTRKDDLAGCRIERNF